MRRLALIPSCLALVQAFFMAPYQHVHIGLGHDKHGDHYESTIVHAHPYAISVPTNANSSPAVQRYHKPHASVALDTFITLTQGVPFLFFQPEPPIQIFVPTQAFVSLEITEPCGHDPPDLDFCSPRAPPA